MKNNNTYHLSFSPKRLVWAEGSEVYDVATLQKVDSSDLPDTGELISKMENQKSELEELKGRLNTLRQSITRGKTIEKLQELKEARVKREDLSSDEEAALDAQIAEHKEELEAKETKLARLEALLEKIQEKIDKIAELIEKLKADIQEAHEKLDQSVEDKESLEEDFDEYQKAAAILGDVLDIFNNIDFNDPSFEWTTDEAKDAAQNMHPRTQDTKDHMDLEADRILAEIEELEREIARLNEEITALEAEKAEKEESLEAHETLEAKVKGVTEDVRKLVAAVTDKREKFLEINSLLTELPSIRSALENYYAEIDEILASVDWKRLDLSFFTPITKHIEDLTQKILGSLNKFAQGYNLEGSLRSSISNKLRRKLRIDVNDPQQSIVDFLDGLGMDDIFSGVISGLESAISKEDIKTKLKEYLQGNKDAWDKFRTGFEGMFRKVLEEEGNEVFIPEHKERLQKLRKENQELLFGSLLEAMFVYKEAPRNAKNELSKIKSTGKMKVTLKKGGTGLGTYMIKRSEEGDYSINGEEFSEEHDLMKKITAENQTLADLIEAGKYDDNTPILNITIS